MTFDSNFNGKDEEGKQLQTFGLRSMNSAFSCGFTDARNVSWFNLHVIF